MLAEKIAAAGLPCPQRQSRLPWSHTQRRFVADFAWHDEKVIVEVQGAAGKGRHTTAAGFTRDRIKSNLAQLAGWTVLEVCAAHIRDGSALSWITAALGLGESRAGWLPPKKRPRRKAASKDHSPAHTSV